jgi:hypothetical protein
MNKRDIKAEQKTQAEEVKTVSRTPTPNKRGKKLVAAATADKTTPVKKSATTVVEEKKFDIELSLCAKSDAKLDGKKSKKRSADDFTMEPPAPKRASSAYLFFATEHSAMLRKEKNYSVVEAMKGAGAAWNSLSEKDRQKYEQLAAADVER